MKIKNKLAILLIGLFICSSFLLEGCGNNTNKNESSSKYNDPYLDESYSREASYAERKLSDHDNEAYDVLNDIDGAMETKENSNDSTLPAREPLPSDTKTTANKPISPTPLTSLQFTEMNFLSIGCDGGYQHAYSEDVNGMKYDANTLLFPTNIALVGGLHNESLPNYVTYRLDGQYSQLSGKVYRTSATLESDESWRDGYVKIYGDGELLYESNITSNTNESYTISIDISGVNELKIVLEGLLTCKDRDGLPIIKHPKVCMAEVILE